MRKKAWTSALMMLGIAALARAQGGTATDEKAIRDIETRWETAWNHHDVAGMAATYAPDSDAINLAGEWFKGRDAFQKSLEELHSGKTKGSVWQTERTAIRFLTPEIAIVHVYVNSHGDRNPDGSAMAPRHVLLTRVEMKRGGKWLIVASQATNIVPRASASAAAESKARPGE
ncbi:MAG TPA: SgcJ/EcaC family oxidoreductase [Verrucomicrobiae bacterium]|nr:SgcJ/EcaC family oxidoreductase [Verrucomicrobiae bacterium]